MNKPLHTSQLPEQINFPPPYSSEEFERWKTLHAGIIQDEIKIPLDEWMEILKKSSPAKFRKLSDFMADAELLSKNIENGNAYMNRIQDISAMILVLNDQLKDRGLL